MKRLAMFLSMLFASAMAFGCHRHGIETLLIPVSRIRQTPLWMSKEAISERLSALTADGRFADAQFYQFMHEAAIAFLALVAVTGMFIGWMWGRKPQLPLRQTRTLILAIAGLAILSPLLRPWMAPEDQPVFAAMPAYWLCGLIASAAVLGRFSALSGHDLALWVRASVGLSRPENAPAQVLIATSTFTSA